MNDNNEMQCIICEVDLEGETIERFLRIADNCKRKAKKFEKKGLYDKAKEEYNTAGTFIKAVERMRLERK